MQNFSENLDLEIEQLKNLKERCSKEKRKSPSGRLTAEFRNGKTYYKLHKKGEVLRLSETDEMVSKMQARKLYEEIEARANRNLELLEEVKKKYQPINPFACRDNLPKAYQGVPDQVIADLGFLTNEVFHAQYQTDSQYRSLQRVHTLSSGEKVRSRAEVLIAEIYLARGIDFVYEPCVILKGSIAVHPDFAVFAASDGSIVLHEHVGKLKNEEYRRYYEWKMDQYIRNDILPMRDIVFSYEKEDGMLDVKALEQMISTYLL